MPLAFTPKLGNQGKGLETLTGVSPFGWLQIGITHVFMGMLLPALGFELVHLQSGPAPSCCRSGAAERPGALLGCQGAHSDFSCCRPGPVSSAASHDRLYPIELNLDPTSSMQVPRAQTGPRDVVVALHKASHRHFSTQSRPRQQLRRQTERQRWRWRPISLQAVPGIQECCTGALTPNPFTCPARVRGTESWEPADVRLSICLTRTAWHIYHRDFWSLGPGSLSLFQLLSQGTHRDTSSPTFLPVDSSMLSPDLACTKTRLFCLFALFCFSDHCLKGPSASLALEGCSPCSITDFSAASPHVPALPMVLCQLPAACTGVT